MEMNTRLQVEHPVTEEITGQDLVEWQLRVASGEPLPRRQDELSINGWAMEARLYAEDPAKGFLPSVGTLKCFDLPTARKVKARIESGVQQGDAISPFYDPMIAKLIVSADSRDDAVAGLAMTCGNVRCWPVRTNAAFLKRLLEREEFREGRLDTSFIGNHLEELAEASDPPDEVLQAVATMIVDETLGGKANDIREAYLSRDPTGWGHLEGFRLNAPPAETVIRLTEGGRQYEVTFEDRSVNALPWVERVSEGYLVRKDGQTYLFSQTAARGTGATHGLHGGDVEAPMPGKVTALDVSDGEKVVKGQRLLTLEAMKMEHALTAPFDGTVAELAATAGAQVTDGTVLVRVEPDAPAAS
jgi:3-methylcrotonyl-CoA carboxylase alpha subunit